MNSSDIDPAAQASLVSLRAQHIALVAALEMHVRRSEELSVQVALLEEEMSQLTTPVTS